MKDQLLRLALAVTLILLCAWPGASIAQAAIADAVGAWGHNEFGQTTVPLTAQSGVTAIAAGVYYTVALKNDGTVVAWGENYWGQVTGTPTTDEPSFGIASPVTLGDQVLSGVTAIAAGADHTVALKNDGSLVVWGNNEYGQSIVPAGLSGATAIAAGFWHTVALVIPTAPNITTQPVGQAVNVWQSASFTVGTAGFPLHYQWRKDGVNLAGATSATYSLTFAQTNQAGSYTVVVSNSTGSVTSAPPAVLTVNAVAAPGTVATWGDYGFVINGAITITKYTGSPVAVIPSEINGLPVTTIGNGAFASPSLTSVTIPGSVTSIGRSAFAGTSLTNVTIPKSVTSIDLFPFAGCIRLTGITVDTLNAVYSSVDGVFFNKSQTTLITYPRGKPGNYTIPNSVTTIADYAIAYCTSLTNVTIPNSVTSIGNGAFLESASLNSVTIPESVTSIGYLAFGGCTSLTIATIPNSVTHIGDGAFSSCTSLTNLTIPNSVTGIGNEAFSSCTSVISVTIPNRVTSIGYQAFAHCTGLTGVTIPNSVTYFGRGAFYECTSLTEVYFEGNAWDLMEDRRIAADNFKGPLFDQSPNATVFYLPGTSGWGTTIGGRPTAQWVLPYPIILTTAPSFGVQTNALGFIISWATKVPVVVEASTTLANPVWTSVSTNTLTDGWSHFSDTEWTNHPSRFYRIRGQRSSPF